MLKLILVVLSLSTLPLQALRLSPDGDTVAGAGAGRIAYNNAALPVSVGGGSPNWLTSTKIVYGAVKDGREWAVVSYDLTTMAATIVAAGGGNDVFAGGGVWARWLGDGRTGLTTSTGFACARCGLLEVGPDGTVYYNRNRDDRGLVARRPDGTETQLLPDSARTPIVVRGTVGGAIWGFNSPQIGTWNLPTPVTRGTVYNPRAARVRGEWWLVYGDGVRILAQPFREPRGYVLASFGNVFSIDAVALGDTLRVAYSTTQGEQPGDIRTVDVDLDAPRVDLGIASPTPPVVTPPPPAETAIPNHKSVVVAARGQFAAFPAGPERAYKIVNATAWMLRAEGAGLYFKPSGTNFAQRSIDIIMYRDGRTFDVLGDAEGSADPQWSATKPTGREKDLSKWRAPVQPGVPPSTPPPVPTPPPSTPVPDTLQAQVTELRAAVTSLAARVKVLEERPMPEPPFATRADIEALKLADEEQAKAIAMLNARRYKGSVLGIPVSITEVQ